jgi:NADPH-dependent 2,4-dienoyl-CoA reductase/sulfur reductase-like enzyme
VLTPRRRFLAAAAGIGAAALLPARSSAAPAGRRVAVVGGGWGGLAAARHLKQAGPELDVTLIERQAEFFSLPLSNKWLVGQADDALLRRDYAAAARTHGYRFVQAEVAAIDRERRQVVTAAGRFDYDWLVLAVGIRHDYAAWFGDDRESAEFARNTYPAAWTPGDGLATLRARLERFRGGDLLMTIPPAPFRCPPAPYERAVLLAGWFAARKIPARIVIVDANPPFQEFQRIFRDRHEERIVYHTQATIRGVDPRKREVHTEFESFGFDDAILMPPQQAGDLAWQAGLIGRDGAGAPTGWAAAHPLSFASAADPRIHLVGDMLDQVSPLFGHYPKAGQMAARQGRSVARRIAALAQGKEPPRELPDSLCHIATQYAPPEAIRIAASYRLRGDGALMQQQTTQRDPQPRGEDADWLRRMLVEIGLPG